MSGATSIPCPNCDTERFLERIIDSRGSLLWCGYCSYLKDESEPAQGQPAAFLEALAHLDADTAEAVAERAAIMEIDGRLPRSEAEARALDLAGLGPDEPEPAGAQPIKEPEPVAESEVLRKALLTAPIFMETTTQRKPDSTTEYKTAAGAFLGAPSHGTAADVLVAVLGAEIIAEKTAMNGTADYYKKAAGGCTYEPFPTIKTAARDVLEAAVDDAFEALGHAVHSKDIKDLYAAAGKAKTKARTKDFITGALTFFADRVLVSPSIPWNETAEAIPTLTSVLDLSGDELKMRAPRFGEYFRNPAPCRAEDILAASGAPRFEAFLESLFSDPETRRSALECFASTISGKPSKTLQCWTNEEGDGGKNTAYDLLAELVPSRMVMAKSAVILYRGDTSERRFGEAPMQGRSAVFFDEVGGTYDVPQIKRLTGISTIRGELKGRDQIEFAQTWALVALSNGLPRFFPPNDGGFLSRVFVLPFSSVFFTDEAARQRRLNEGIAAERLKPAADKSVLVASILEERSAILKLLGETWIAMRPRLGRPYESPECLRAREAYRSANDLAERFFAEYLVRDEDGAVDYAAIKEAWSEFTGEARPAMREVIAGLAKRYPWIQPAKVHGTRRLKGISLRQDDKPPTTTESGDAGDAKHDFPSREEKNEKIIYGVKNAVLSPPRPPNDGNDLFPPSSPLDGCDNCRTREACNPATGTTICSAFKGGP